MSNENVDLGVAYGDVEDLQDFFPIPDGNYTLQVTETTTDKARETGNTLIKVWCKVLNPPTGEPPKNADGKPQKWADRQVVQFTIHPKSMPFIKKFCGVIGVKWSGTTLPTGQFLNKKFIGVVGQQIYNGKPINRVNNYLPAKG